MLQNNCVSGNVLVPVVPVLNWLSGTVNSLLKKGFIKPSERCVCRVKAPYNRPPRAPRGSRGIAILILNLGARRGWTVSTTPRPLYPRERPGTHCTGGWVGPRAGLEAYEKSLPHRDSIPGPSSP
jgi:hypothetical protein